MNVPEPPGTGWAPPTAQPPWMTWPRPAGQPPWTTEPPPTAAPPQGRLGRRVSAALADIAVLSLLFLILGLAIGATPASNLPPGTLNLTGGDVYFGLVPFQIRFGEVTVAGWWLAGYLVMVLLYFFVLEAATGQTLGKRLLGLRVTSRDGTRPSTAAIAVRTLLRLVDWLPLLYLAGFITVLATGQRRQRLGDLAARTRVAVRPGVPAARWPAVVTGIVAGLAILGMSVRVTVGASSVPASAGPGHPCQGVSFHHPAGWFEEPDQGSGVGKAPLCGSALVLGPSDGIAVEGYALPEPVTAASLAVATSSVTSEFRRDATRAGGTLRTGPQRTTVGGLPAIRFQFRVRSYNGTPVTGTIVALFDGRTRYDIFCQQSRAHAAQVTRACGQVLRTLAVPGGPGGGASTAPSPAPSAAPAAASSPQRWLQGLGSLKQQMNDALSPGVVTAGVLRRTAATLRRCTSELTGLGPPAKVLRPTYRLASRACAAFAQAAAYATAAARAYYTSGPAGRTETKLINHTDAAFNHGIRLIANAFYGAPVLPPG